MGSNICGRCCCVCDSWRWERGHVTGVVSAIDVIRGLLGLPAVHPAGFPHLDAETHLTWTDDVPLDLDHLEWAPDGPGVVQIIHGGAGMSDAVVWVEACENCYTRLTDMLAEPQSDQPNLSWWLRHQPLRFRAAAASDAAQRAHASSAVITSSETGHSSRARRPATYAGQTYCLRSSGEGCTSTTMP